MKLKYDEKHETNDFARGEPKGEYFIFMQKLWHRF